MLVLLLLLFSSNVYTIIIPDISFPLLSRPKLEIFLIVLLAVAVEIRGVWMRLFLLITKHFDTPNDEACNARLCTRKQI